MYNESHFFDSRCSNGVVSQVYDKQNWRQSHQWQIKGVIYWFLVTNMCQIRLLFFVYLFEINNREPILIANMLDNMELNAIQQQYKHNREKRNKADYWLSQLGRHVIYLLQTFRIRALLSFRYCPIVLHSWCPLATILVRHRPSRVLGGIRGYTPYTNLRVFLTAYTHLSDHK